MHSWGKQCFRPRFQNISKQTGSSRDISLLSLQLALGYFFPSTLCFSSSAFSVSYFLAFFSLTQDTPVTCRSPYVHLFLPISFCDMVSSVRMVVLFLADWYVRGWGCLSGWPAPWMHAILLASKFMPVSASPGQLASKSTERGERSQSYAT